MSISPRISEQPRATRVEFARDTFTVFIEDGRAVTVPIEWFPRLRDASPAQRRCYELIGNGIGLHWEEIDEDIWVWGLLNPEKCMMANYPPKAAVKRGPKAPRKTTKRAAGTRRKKPAA